MGRSIATVVFAALFALGVIGALASSGAGRDQFGEPPAQLAQFDEQATAEFNDRAAARANRDQLLIGLSITLGLVGIVVVAIGRFGDAD